MRSSEVKIHFSYPFRVKKENKTQKNRYIPKFRQKFIEEREEISG